jgi:hypothetical protein
LQFNSTRVGGHNPRPPINKNCGQRNAIKERGIKTVRHQGLNLKKGVFGRQTKPASHNKIMTP